MVLLRMRIPVSIKIPCFPTRSAIYIYPYLLGHKINPTFHCPGYHVSLGQFKNLSCWWSPICSETAIKRCQVFQASNGLVHLLRGKMWRQTQVKASWWILIWQRCLIICCNQSLTCICDSVEWHNFDKGTIPAFRVMLSRNVNRCFTTCPLSTRTCIYWNPAFWKHALVGQKP